MKTTIQKRPSLRGTVRPAIASMQLNRRRAQKMLDRIDLLHKEQALLAPEDPRWDLIDDEIEDLLVRSQEIS